MRELGHAVAQLNTMNRYRFQDDPNALGAWDTAVDLRVGCHKGGGAAPAASAPPALPPGPTNRGSGT